MMYVDVICKGIDDILIVDVEICEFLLYKYDIEGFDNFCVELKLLDLEYYKIVDLKNFKWVIYVLEICYMIGKIYIFFCI